MNRTYYDISGVQLKDGDIININQTVNGENMFVIMKVNPLDIRYLRDIDRKYEYDKEDLITDSELTGEVDFDITGNLFEILNNCRVVYT